MQSLDTKRLHLRLLTAADADFILELVNEPAWLRFIGDRNVRNRTDAAAYIEKCLLMRRQHGVCLLAVELMATNTAVGLCGLLKRESLRDIDLGFAFLERFRGRGYAHEAASAVLQHGHTALGLQRIVALASPENERSIALLRKLGFRFESSLQGPDGKIQTHLFAHLTSSEEFRSRERPPT